MKQKINLESDSSVDRIVTQEEKYLEYFKDIGFWELNDKYKSNKSLVDSNLRGINFIIDKEYRNLENVIYLFKTYKEVLYIGETSRGIQSRFESYRYGFDRINDTDNRVKIGITEELQNNNKVEILVYYPETKFEFGGESLNIPLSKPIEEYLISKIHPKLNKNGK